MEKRGNHQEVIDMSDPVVCEGNIEAWLKILEQRMQ